MTRSGRNSRICRRGTTKMFNPKFDVIQQAQKEGTHIYLFFDRRVSPQTPGNFLRQALKNMRDARCHEATMCRMMRHTKWYSENMVLPPSRWPPPNPLSHSQDCQECRERLSTQVQSTLRSSCRSRRSLRPSRMPESSNNIENPVVKLNRHLYAHPLAGLFWEEDTSRTRHSSKDG